MHDLFRLGKRLYEKRDAGFGSQLTGRKCCRQRADQQYPGRKLLEFRLHGLILPELLFGKTLLRRKITLPGPASQDRRKKYDTPAIRRRGGPRDSVRGVLEPEHVERGYRLEESLERKVSDRVDFDQAFHRGQNPAANHDP